MSSTEWLLLLSITFYNAVINITIIINFVNESFRFTLISFYNA